MNDNAIVRNSNLHWNILIIGLEIHVTEKAFNTRIALNKSVEIILQMNGMFALT